MARDVLIPDPLVSDREHNRFCHLDLRDIETGELEDELHALWPLLWGLDSEHWLRERVSRLRSELARRRPAYAAGRGAK